jgi:hypothetical protein
MTDAPFTAADRHELTYWLASEGTRGSRMRDAIEAALREIDRLRHHNDEYVHWKLRVLDALITNWAYRKEHEDDPKLAVNDLITAEIEMALDPQISKAAADLVQNERARVKTAVTALVEGVVDQQAMPDDFWRSKLAAIFDNSGCEPDDAPSAPETAEGP